jgi:two-component system NtrC family sensor kinase
MADAKPSHSPPRHDLTDLRSVLTSEGFVRQDEAFETEADRALKQRPLFTIRSRLLLAFILFFVLCLGITLWSMAMLADVQGRILFLEVAGDYKAEIQQARRFEKNYLLYGTTLDDAREHVANAQRLAVQNTESFMGVVGEKAFMTMNQHLAAYLHLLDQLSKAESAEDRIRFETELRDHGAIMVYLAEQFVSKERDQVHSRLSLARRVPFAFLGVLLLLMLLGGSFLLRQILGSLSRFLKYTERIGTGDFTPITPTRRYRDEFSELALMINRMVRGLDRQHRILVESHKLRAMGTLVAGVAHELNNPLNNIMLTASLLKEEYDGLDDSERQEMLTDLISQAERSKRTVRNLLDFARESETKVESLNIRKLLDETTQLLRNQLRVKKIRLNQDLPEVLPAVHGDRQLLSQVFMNLIINAIDVLPEKGEIGITADVERQNGFLAVDISDNGPGIPEHTLAQIFDPFFTTKPQGKGTGLGLSVSRGIVRKLGGYLLVSSKLGEGTTFTVLLPITTIPSEISAPGVAAADVDKRATTGVS